MDCLYYMLLLYCILYYISSRFVPVKMSSDIVNNVEGNELQQKKKKKERKGLSIII